MAMTCKEVWKEISEYIDDTVTPDTRRELELHFLYCRHCAAIVDGIHNIIVLVADERTFALPAGFSSRLRTKLQNHL